MTWTTEGRGLHARALNTKTGAHNMREHRTAKREQAEARNAAYQKRNAKPEEER